MAQADRQFVEARRYMVLTQLRPNKVTDEQVIDAMAAIPREQFVPKAYRGVAYMDEDVAVAPGRALMEPMVLARLLQEAETQPQDIVLVVGCATGYDVAVAAKIANTVIGLEPDADLVGQASQTLEQLGIDNVAVVQGISGTASPSRVRSMSSCWPARFRSFPARCCCNWPMAAVWSAWSVRPLHRSARP